MALHSGRSKGFLGLGLALVAVAVCRAGATSVADEPRAESWWADVWKLDSVWDLARGSGILVAVVDGGVQANVLEFRGAVVQGRDLQNGHDGRVDLDSESHGTAMAALVAGRERAGSHVIGVAPNSMILPIAIGGDGGGVSTASAIRYAVNHQAHVISMSYGSAAFDCPPILRAAVGYALDHDVVLVAAAGNDGDGGNAAEIPAACPGVVAVGAVDEAGRPWVGTQRQAYVDLAAPGVRITSVDKRGQARVGTGTSDAAALVSGVVALVRGRFPGMSGREVVGRLLATARDAGAPGRDDQTGFGIVRPLEALTARVPAGSPNPVYEEVDRVRGSTELGVGRARVEVRMAWRVAWGAVAAAGLVVVGALVGRRRRVGRLVTAGGEAGAGRRRVHEE
jgi:subtilisin family serine protease